MPSKPTKNAVQEFRFRTLESHSVHAPSLNLLGYITSFLTINNHSDPKLRYVYAQSTYIQRVPQCMSPRWNWDPPPLSPASVPLPLEPKEVGAHSPAGEGLEGGVPIPTTGEKSLALCPTLCVYCTVPEFIDRFRENWAYKFGYWSRILHSTNSVYADVLPDQTGLFTGH
jgi:hypothetical protein